MGGAAPFFAELAETPPPDRLAWLEVAGARIRVAAWSEGARGTVLLLTGRTEYLEKYGRVIRRLQGMGFAVAGLDWRGQGLSSRPAGAPMRGDVVDFDFYQRDVAAFLDWPPAAGLPRPHLLLAHSMGGCIALRALVARRAHPDLAVFSAPMWGLRLPLPVKLALQGAARAATVAGFGLTAAPWSGGDGAYALRTRFEDNVLTSDPGHWAWFRAHLEARPELGLGAPSLRWLDRAFHEMGALRAETPPNLPTLLLLGSDEKVVAPEAIQFYAERAGARLETLQGARHESLMEPDDRAPGLHAWHVIESFLAAEGV